MSRDRPRLRRALLLALALAVLAPAAPSAAKVLPMKEELQLYSQWCWAAVSGSLLHFYGHQVKQCTIADYTRTVATWHDFGKVDCCVDAYQGCDYWNYYAHSKGSIQDILLHFAQVSSVGKGVALDQTTVGAEIDSHGRPFVVRWGWLSGGGHFVIGHGLLGDKLHYMNPWFGEGKKVGSYSWVLSGGNHRWTHTVQISSTCRCTAQSACCDGCQPRAEGSACNDGNACTAGDTCHSGICDGTSSVSCTTPGTCQGPGTCDPQSGGCVYPPLKDGVGCDDGDRCTPSDTCSAGSCVPGAAISCPAPEVCHATPVCEPQSGLCQSTRLADGTACDDGDPCTLGDGCSDGSCAGTPKVCPTPGPCQNPGICQAPDGRCIYTDAPDGTTCGEGRSCRAGRCVAPDGGVEAGGGGSGGCGLASGGAGQGGLWGFALLALLGVFRRLRRTGGTSRPR